jgi:uncharacterized membrane protein YjfL (UPF0719 family)
MPETLWKLLIQGSAAAVVAVVLWPVVRRLMDKTIEQLELRVKSAEEAAAVATARAERAEAKLRAVEELKAACEHDRSELHERFSDFLLKFR